MNFPLLPTCSSLSHRGGERGGVEPRTGLLVRTEMVFRAFIILALWAAPAALGQQLDDNTAQCSQSLMCLFPRPACLSWLRSAPLCMHTHAACAASGRRPTA